MLNLLIFLFCFFVFLGIYFIPVIVAKYRGIRHLGSIIVVNIFLGITFVGWVVALAMACSDNFKKEQESDQLSF